MFKNNGKMHPWNKQIKMLSFLQNKKIKLRIFLNLPTYKGKAKNLKLKEYNQGPIFFYHLNHELRTPGEEIVFTARPKINSQSQISRYGQSIFCLPHRPNFLGFASTHGLRTPNHKSKKSENLGRCGRQNMLWS